MNNLARPWEVIVLWVRIKIPCLENQSTTRWIAVKPSEGGSCSMKSMEIEFHRHSGTGRGQSNP